MNICLDTLLIASAPIEIQLALGEWFLASATILFCLSAEAGHYPMARRSLQRYLRADYWIARQRRKHLAYSHSVALLGLRPRSTVNRQPGKCGGRASGPASLNIHPGACVGHA